MNELKFTHHSTLSASEMVEYFFNPEKIQAWFAHGNAACVSKPIKNGIEIMVLQDHYLEWIYPSSFSTLIQSPLKFPFRLRMTQIFFGFEAPVLTSVEVTISELQKSARVDLLLTGEFDESFRKELVDDWGSIERLFPFPS